jgi:phosphoglycolate phosphatase-like HAD superfamily hydrolase
VAYTTFIFDLDGTVWDSFPFYSRILSEFSGTDAKQHLAELSSDRPLVSLLRMHGISERSLIRKMSESAHLLHLFPGMQEVLQAFRSRGFRQFIVSNLPSRYGEELVSAKGLREFFYDGFYYRKGYAKPSPKGMKCLLGRHGIGQRETVLSVGDSMSDRQASIGAGLNFAWAGYGYAKDLIVPGGDRMLNDPLEILEM